MHAIGIVLAWVPSEWMFDGCYGEMAMANWMSAGRKPYDNLEIVLHRLAGAFFGMSTRSNALP